MRKENISYWTKSAKIDDFPKLSESIETDRLVIGGGIAGILTAHALASINRKVILIDGRKLAQETTANTTAKITAQHGPIFQTYLDSYGEDKARLIYDSQIDGINHIAELEERYDIYCDFERLSSFLVTNSECFESLQKEKEAYDLLRIPHNVQETGIDLPVENTYALEIPNQAQFNPIKFLAHMVNTLSELENGQAGIFMVDGNLRAIYKDNSGQKHETGAVCTHMGYIVNFNDD
ncbi:FAD-dependent oxidoreductase [Aliicoccus persicus]|uniref:FAD dependent oxidoreductase n=1 Tax=Aliicoccus persicus TaxID=930138 RepID=A0A662Z4V8_9STAP|nr:FAD-dependent oxidoreductase [Aliicoccus persicus]SEW14283.1 FAD dependent oxidoreductase [Aliicoccus persicus]